MITYSIIQKSHLEGANRLDAEYYQPMYLSDSAVLHKLKLTKLSEICKISDGNHSAISERFTDSGVRYLRGKDLQDFFISDADPVYVSDSVYVSLKRSHIYPQDVLVSIVGTIGLVSIVSDRYSELTGNCKIAILHAQNIDPHFLSVFLACKYGQFQIHRKVAGAVQTGIILKDLAEVFIPIVNETFQKKISDIVKSAHESLINSQTWHREAEQFLLHELGLTDYVKEDDVGYVVNFSNIKNAERMDAEFFQPKYEELTKKLMVNNAIQLGDIVSTKKGFEPGSDAYREQGKLFIRVSSLSKFGIEDTDQKYLSDDFYETLKKEYEPKVGEILLTKDASPGIAFVLKEPVQGIISGGILRLQLKDTVDPEYVALCINSLAGQMQVERDAGGSIISHWKPEQVKRMLIPILPNNVQQKISDLVIQSHEARKKSKELLEQAKRDVEEMIEREGRAASL